LRTPLVGLFGFCEILSKTKLNDDQRDHLKIINFSASLLNNLIENLLDFSRLEKRELKLNQEEFGLPSMIKYLRTFFTEFARQKKVRPAMQSRYFLTHKNKNRSTLK
jgi:signal transduction histidine kinase